MRLVIEDNVVTVTLERSGEPLNGARALLRERGYVRTGAWAVTGEVEVYVATVRKDLRSSRRRV